MILIKHYIKNTTTGQAAAIVLFAICMQTILAYINKLQQNGLLPLDSAIRILQLGIYFHYYQVNNCYDDDLGGMLC